MKRVLFVDDEPKILSGLRRMLRGERKSWEMVFANGPEEALEHLGEGTFDVVVSDMRMPGMDGATLLSKVRDMHPNSVRIVLSGHAEVEAAMRAVNIAHQFLSKPCDTETIKNVIGRSCRLQELMQDESVRRIAGQMDSLPVLPEVFNQLEAALSDAECSMADLARIVETDVGMSAKLLQMVNSAFFGLPREISTIAEAINFLGLKMLRNLVMTVEVFQSTDGVVVPGFKTGVHQRHSMLTANLAKQIMRESGYGDDAFLAGILHDVGHLLLATQLPEMLTEVFERVSHGEESLADIEKSLWGVTHGEIGAYLLGIWGLPHRIVEAVAYHHAPEIVEEQELNIVTAVHVADMLIDERTEGMRHKVLASESSFLQQRHLGDKLDEWQRMADELVGADEEVEAL